MTNYVLVLIILCQAQSKLPPRDRNHTDDTKKALIQLNAEINKAISSNESDILANLLNELDQIWDADDISYSHYKMISQIIIQNKIAGMIPSLARKIDRSAWAGSIKSWITEYPATKALAVFGTKATEIITSEILRSDKQLKVLLLAYTLTGIEGEERARYILLNLKDQTHNENSRRMIEDARQSIIQSGQRWSADFENDKIPRIPESEMVLVTPTAAKTRAVTMSVDALKPPSQRVDVEVPVDSKVSDKGRQPQSARKWSLLAILAVGGTSLLWFLLKQHERVGR